jgi:PEP-CTERM motif
MQLKALLAVTTLFVAAICAAPAHALFLSGDSTLEGSSSSGLQDFDNAADVGPGARGWLPTDEPTGYYYIVSDSLTGNTFIFTGTWMGIGNCTADKCISDLKGDGDPLAVQGVPEPGTVMLLGLAFGLLGFIIRRRDA